MSCGAGEKEQAVDKGCGDDELVNRDAEMHDNGLTLPSIREWGKDSVFWAHHRVLLKHLMDSTEKIHLFAGQYKLWGRPIRHVDVCGYVVLQYRRESKIVFQVDDGSSIMPCVLWENWEPSAADRSSFGELEQYMVELKRNEFNEMAARLTHGALVRIRGDLSEFYYKPQVTVHSVESIEPNEEVFHWLECIDLYQTCYSKSYVAQG